MLNPALRSPRVNPGCAGAAVDLWQHGRDEDAASASLEELYSVAPGRSRGPPDERAWLGFSVWQTAPKLCCSCSGEFPQPCWSVAQGKELQCDASRTERSQEK